MKTRATSHSKYVETIKVGDLLVLQNPRSASREAPEPPIRLVRVTSVAGVGDARRVRTADLIKGPRHKSEASDFAPVSLRAAVPCTPEEAADLTEMPENIRRDWLTVARAKFSQLLTDNRAKGWRRAKKVKGRVKATPANQPRKKRTRVRKPDERLVDTLVPGQMLVDRCDHTTREDARKPIVRLLRITRVLLAEGSQRETLVLAENQARGYAMKKDTRLWSSSIQWGQTVVVNADMEPRLVALTEAERLEWLASKLQPGMPFFVPSEPLAVSPLVLTAPPAPIPAQVSLPFVVPASPPTNDDREAAIAEVRTLLADVRVLHAAAQADRESARLAQGGVLALYEEATVQRREIGHMRTAQERSMQESFQYQQESRAAMAESRAIMGELTRYRLDAMDTLRTLSQKALVELASAAAVAAAVPPTPPPVLAPAPVPAPMPVGPPARTMPTTSSKGSA